MSSTDASNEHASVPANTGPSTDVPTPGTLLPIQQLVRNAAAIAAVLYVAGLLTTNAYLYSLGVSDFSLLRTRFVLTGVVTLIPLMLALVWGAYAAVAVAFGGAAGGAARTYRWVLSDVAIPFALHFSLFFFLFWYAAGNDPLVSARDAALLSVTCAVAVLVLFGSLAFSLWTGGRPCCHFYQKRSLIQAQFTRWVDISDAVVEGLVFAIVGSLLVLAYLGFFGHRFYPTIPEQLGGGQPRVVQFLIASDAIPAARELGLDVTADAPLTPPIELLWEGEETYVIRLPSPHERAIVQLVDSLVGGVVTGAPITRMEIRSDVPELTTG